MRIREWKSLEKTALCLDVQQNRKRNVFRVGTSSTFGRPVGSATTAYLPLGVFGFASQRFRFARAALRFGFLRRARILHPLPQGIKLGLLLMANTFVLTVKVVYDTRLREMDA
jgi:hypothetical protein